MRIVKQSSLYKRLFLKKYFYNYLNILEKLLIKKGNKLRAKNIVKVFIKRIKFYFSKSINNLKIIFNSCISFINIIFEKNRLRTFLVEKEVAGKYYFIPTYITYNKSRTMLLRWFIKNAKTRLEKTLGLRLAGEFIALYRSEGKTWTQLSDYYKIAYTNRVYLRLLRKRSRKFLLRLKKYGYFRRNVF